jgi:FkbM family methyltransferase
MNIKDAFKLSNTKTDFSGQDFLSFKPRKWPHGIKIRNTPIDKRTLRDVLVSKYHLPSNRVKLQKGSIILDLGSNIGLTIAHLKNVYPDAIIIGYEMDEENFLLAQKNIQKYNNVRLFNKAIWINNSIIEYDKKTDSDAFTISTSSSNEQNVKIKGATLKEIINEHQIQKIDYLKMDIEGAEKDILTHHDLSWLEFVNALNIEFHVKGQSIEPYIDIIKSHGFDAWKDTKHLSSIMAVRKSASNNI